MLAHSLHGLLRMGKIILIKCTTMRNKGSTDLVFNISKQC